MSKDPTGTIISTPTGRAVVIERTFRAPIEDVWASITESERLSRWIGHWTGEPGVGNVVRFTMSAEDGAQPEDVTIVACDPPRTLRAHFSQGDGTWHVEVDLAEFDGVTTLLFRQSIAPGEESQGMGPGWEFYLDRLVADHADAPMPDWDDYYPHQQMHYEAAAAALG